MNDATALETVHRLVPEGLLYDADPRHVEMLAASFVLSRKPGEKTSQASPGQTPNCEDRLVELTEDHEELHGMVASIEAALSRQTHVAVCVAGISEAAPGGYDPSPREVRLAGHMLLRTWESIPMQHGRNAGVDHTQFSQKCTESTTCTPNGFAALRGIGKIGC